MQGIQFKKNEIRLLAILLVLVYLPLLSFFSISINGSILQDSQTVNISQDSISDSRAGKDAWQSKEHHNPLVDILVQEIDLYQNMQRLLSWENNSHMMIFCGLSYGLFFHATPGLISLSRSIQIPIYKIKYFLIAPHSPNAPPYILAGN